MAGLPRRSPLADGRFTAPACRAEASREGGSLGVGGWPMFYPLPRLPSVALAKEGRSGGQLRLGDTIIVMVVNI